MNELFEQSEINGMTLSNRFVRSATWEGLATDKGACTPKLIDLMVRLVEGGVGLIITGHAYVRQDGQSSRWQLGIYEDELIPGLLAMTRAIHERGGKIVLQIAYGGAYLSKLRIKRMTIQDIQEVIKAFGQAAERAKKAGFDGVQIFSAHGFFLSQFLSPRTNNRTDMYGGDIQNRARALLEVLQSIRDAVGRNYPVLVKLNCQDFVENGLSLEDSIQVGAMLEEGGIDAFELSGGLLNLPDLGPMRKEIHTEDREAFFQGEARAFKGKLHVPLILVGGIRSHNVAQRLVEEGVADYISMSRPLIQEPGLINRWKTGDLQRATCISCNNCFDQIKTGEGVSCIPLEGFEADTFFPELSETIPTSSPHPPGTSYKISVGLEVWESNYIPVVKIQMVHNGKVLNRTPSLPLGSKDHDEISRAITGLLEQHKTIHSKK